MTLRLVRPLCTRMMRLSKSVSSTAVMRATPSTTLSAVGSGPPARLVPAPRGTTGTRSAWQRRITAATSAVEDGSTTASGGQR